MPDSGVKRWTGRACALAFALLPSQAVPQTISVTTPAPVLGNVVSSPAGDTVFTVAPSTGGVTRKSGTGYRLTSGTTRAIVTLTCGGQGACNKQDVQVTISAIGSPSGRARALTNFTVSNGTATIKTQPTGTNPITFTLDPLGRNSTKYFYVGMDFPIAGDGSGLPTGLAQSAFQISANAASVSLEAIGEAQATVFRPITVSLLSNLNFGRISRPHADQGTVSIDASSGERSVSGPGVKALTDFTLASYQVNGEGGQVFSVDVQPSFTMSGPGSITVTTNTDASGAQRLEGTLGSAGAQTFKVGGSFDLQASTPLGNYTGRYSVTVNYN